MGAEVLITKKRHPLKNRYSHLRATTEYTRRFPTGCPTSRAHGHTLTYVHRDTDMEHVHE